MEFIIPRHLGVIIDGNRRWAKKRGLPPWKGHEEGAKNLDRFLNWCLEFKIPKVSVYTISTENLKRSKIELKHLFKILEEYINSLLDEKKKFPLLEKYQVKVRFIGELNRLPKRLVKLMGKLMEKTANHQKRVLNFLVAYGGKSEIIKAAVKIAELFIKYGKIEIDENKFENYLYEKEPVDLIIRTGGYQRLSNFLLWQSSYAEIYTTKVLWPDFSKKHFIRALKWFSRQKRNFGK